MATKKSFTRKFIKVTPYTCTYDDGLKMERPVGEMDYTIGFLARKCEKLTINLSQSDTNTSSTQGNL